MRGHAEFWDTLVKVAGEGRRAESSFMGGTCNENLMSLSGHTSHITGIFIPCLDGTEAVTSSTGSAWDDQAVFVSKSGTQLKVVLL